MKRKKKSKLTNSDLTLTEKQIEECTVSNDEEKKIDSEHNDEKSCSNDIIKHEISETEEETEILNNECESDSVSEDELGLDYRVKVPKLSRNVLKAHQIVQHQSTEHPALDEESALKLATIRINLDYDVPPQHNVEKLAGTRVPTKAEKEEISKHIEIKKGSFDSEEDNRIIHNWKKFCKKYNWNQRLIHPFLHVKRKGFFYVSPIDQRRKFVQLLAKGLPERTLYSVYHRFRNLFSKHKQERYTLQEDEILLASIKKNLDNGQKPNYAVLAKKFNRTRASVWRRYILLTKKNKTY